MKEPTMAIWVSFPFGGFHRYVNAPDEVKYLSFPHRHTFYVRVQLQVDPTIDRALEFHMVRDAILGPFFKWAEIQNESPEGLGSCENIAKALSTIVSDLYGSITRRIEVSEDNECGAILEQVES